MYQYTVSLSIWKIITSDIQPIFVLFIGINVFFFFNLIAAKVI